MDKIRLESKTVFRCPCCGKETAGRLPKRGDRTFRYPRRHKGPDGKPCPGNIEEAKWINIPDKKTIVGKRFTATDKRQVTRDWYILDVTWDEETNKFLVECCQYEDRRLPWKPHPTKEDALVFRKIEYFDYYHIKNDLK
jgi:hypothetical protein